MRRILIILTAVALVAAYTATPAVADWEPGDGHKMHFPQLPDEAGWDVNATFPVVLADDWECPQTGWVKDIHFWGSWRGGEEGVIVAFWLRIYANIPSPPSKPGALLWEYNTTSFTTIPIGGQPQGWFDPATGEVIPVDHEVFYQYNIFLDSLDWFWQEAGTIYWLSITAAPLPPNVWGWKTSLQHFMDDGVYSVDPDYFWEPLYDPEPPYETLDLAFVITGEPVEPIPTLTQWGLIGLMLVLLAIATWVFFLRRKALRSKIT